MSRGYAFFGIIGAAACGIFTVYTTFQPEFERRRLEKEGKLPAAEIMEQQNKKRQTILSDAIRSDIKEASQQVGLDSSDAKGGFAWGIRKWARDQWRGDSNSSPPEKT